MELRDLPDPFSKVTSGLISQNKSVRVPLKAVHIRAKVIDMVAKVRQILCENACSMCSIEKFKDWIVHVCHNECIICLIGNHVLIWYSNLILPSFIFFFHPSNLRVIASKNKLFQFIFFKNSNQVVVLQSYKNNMTEPIEAKYVFPLDEKAAVCGFEAFINGKHIIGMYIEVNIPFMLWLKAKKKMSFVGINSKKFYHLKPFF